MLAHLNRWQGPIAALVALVVVLPGLGTSGLLDPWEMDRAAVARLVSGAPQILVIDEDRSLLTRLDKDAGDELSLRRVPTSGEGAAATGLSRASNELSERVHHAVIIDADAVVADRKGGDDYDHLASRIDALKAANRGTLIALVSTKPGDTVRRELAKARARLFHAAHRDGWSRFVLPEAKDAALLWPLMLAEDLTTTPQNAAQTLLDTHPSPWLMVQHKAAGSSTQAPLLDTWLVAGTMRVLGPSEWSARLPGALMLALLAWLTVAAAGALYGPTAGWLALLVLLTLPLSVGSARLVTLAHTASVGTALVAFGIALGGTSKSRWWWLAVLAGLNILLLGRGLGGLAIGTAIVGGYVAASGDHRRSMLLMAGAAAGGLALASWIVLSNDDSALLRTLRFTQVPFGGGLPADRRDFAELVSHLGFGLYPWGPVFLLGCGRMLFSTSAGAAEPATRRDIALMIGFGAPVLGAAVLLPEFGHVNLPVAPLVAVITAAFLTDVLRGKVHGGVVAMLVIIPALLLHREIGKEAGTLVRWLAFDPPLGDDKAAYTWPQELALNKGVRRFVLILTIGFALGLARPVDALAKALTALQSRRAALWAIGLAMIAYTLDVLISLGTRLDVLLRAEATRTGYAYDRLWTTIQMTRPEVIAGAAAFVVLLLGALLIDIGGRRGWHGKRWVRALGWLTRPWQRRWLALATVAAAAAAVAINGMIVFVSIQKMSIGAAFTEGLTSASFAAPLALAVVAVVMTQLPGTLGRRHDWAATDRGTTWSKLLAIVAAGGWFAAALLLLVAVAGIGVGACQTAGTWTYGYLAACWCLALAVSLCVGGAAGGRATPSGAAATWGVAAGAVGVVVAAGVWSVLMGRLLGEPQGPGLKYAGRVLLLAPDSLLLLGLIAVFAVNRMAVRSGALDIARSVAIGGARLAQKPVAAIGLLGIGAMLLIGGYAYGLLPEMSLHFSQKHLLARVEAAGGTVDEAGLPRTFKHATGGRSSIQTNFYTRSMPTIADRDAVLNVLAGVDVGTRVSDFGDLGRSLDLTIAGWSDDNDKDNDGKRDAAAWFGVAKKIEGLALTAAQVGTGDDTSRSPKWRKDQWKGGSLTTVDGLKVRVLGNNEDTLQLAAPTAMVVDDVRRGTFSLDMAKRAAETEKKKAPGSASDMQAGARFVVLAKEQFSELNHLFRGKHGRHIKVLDARSSRLVLAASRLPKGIKDENWLRDSVLSEDDLKAKEGLTRVNVNWDNKMEMVAYHLASRSVRRSQKYKLTLYLKIRNKLPSSYKLFMHPHPLHRDLWPLAYKRETKATEKRCSGCFRTDHWRPGDIIAFAIEQEVPLGTTAGPQDVILGWYDPLSDKRLQLVSARGPGVVKHSDNRVTLAKIQIR
jgi:4-amino-4-deoxy-L-arabinose transferase-like glycosyltransferase